MNIFDALGPVAYAAVVTIVMTCAFIAMRTYSTRSASSLSEVIVEPSVTGRRNNRGRA